MTLFRKKHRSAGRLFWLVPALCLALAACTPAVPPASVPPQESAAAPTQAPAGTLHGIGEGEFRPDLTVPPPTEAAPTAPPPTKAPETVPPPTQPPETLPPETLPPETQPPTQAPPVPTAPPETPPAPTQPPTEPVPTQPPVQPTVPAGSHDANGNGIPDQQDIVTGARLYLAQKPQYNMYGALDAAGYVTAAADGVVYGVCTDVVAAALRYAGYDPRTLIHEDILADLAAGTNQYYGENGEKNYDYRRVRNWDVFLRRHAVSISTDPRDLSAWQPGDIVVFNPAADGGQIWEGHIAIVSDRKNAEGIYYCLHHGDPGQSVYEEDLLTTLTARKPVLGHYRYDGYQG